MGYLQCLGRLAKNAAFCKVADKTLHNCASCNATNLAMSVAAPFSFDHDDHTVGVGTRTYAAPEQMKGTIYNSKVSPPGEDYCEKCVTEPQTGPSSFKSVTSP